MLRHPITRNAGSLYAVQLTSFLLPLLAVPYLARILGPEIWGLVVFAQSFALWLGLWVEYGFNLSATREVASGRTERDRVREVVAGVLGAKGLLVIPVLLIGLIGVFAIPAFRREPLYLWLALLTAVAQGLSPLWYFQGVERMTFPAAVDVAAKTLTVVGIFLIVREPGHGWKVLALQGGWGLLGSGIAIAWMYREVGFAVPRLRNAVASLRMGWTMFLFRGSVSLYTTANAFILGMMAPTGQVAFFGGAEKLTKMLTALLSPVSQAFYPHLSKLADRELDRARVIARISFGLMVGMGLVGAVVLVWLAPLWIRLVLGPQYGPAVPVLRILAITVPLVAASNVLGIQWMLPLRMDRAFNRIIMTAGVVNLVLAVLLVRPYGALGMAAAVVTAEGLVTVAMGIVVGVAGKGFWRRVPGPTIDTLRQSAGRLSGPSGRGDPG